RAQLAATAVDNHEIRPWRFGLAIGAAGDVDRLAGRRRRAGCARHRTRRLVHQPLEAAAPDLPHHAEVVPGYEVGGTNIGIPVLIFLEALRPGDDHRADRVAALDMAVVVDLDAPRRPRQSEGLGQQIQQLALRRALGELPRQRLARIGERVVDELLLLAALRD